MNRISWSQCRKIMNTALIAALLTGAVACGEELETNENGDKLLYECSVESVKYYDTNDEVIEKLGEYDLQAKIYGTSKDEPIQQIVETVNYFYPDYVKEEDKSIYDLDKYKELAKEQPRFPADSRFSIDDDGNLVFKYIFFPEDTEAIYLTFGTRPHAPAEKVAEGLVKSFKKHNNMVCNPPVD